MAVPTDDNVTNRYTFHSYKAQVRATSQGEGAITHQFAHELIARVNSLKQKVENTLNRSDNAVKSVLTEPNKEPNKVGIATLKNCVSRMDEQLQDEQLQEENRSGISP
jgi:hypothetical protein